jgi:hypothetical protein
MQENQISKSKQGSDDHVSATISKNLCKLIINSCYGKTLQTDEKYNNSKIVKNQKQYMNAIEKQFLLDFNILAPAVHRNLARCSANLPFKAHHWPDGIAVALSVAVVQSQEGLASQYGPANRGRWHCNPSRVEYTQPVEPYF